MIHPPTKRQLQALAAIQQLTIPRGPTVRELCTSLGVKSTCTAHRFIEALECKGLVRIVTHGKTRNTVLTEKGERLLAELQHG